MGEFARPGNITSQRFGERSHLLTDKQQHIYICRLDWLFEFGVEHGRLFAQFLHRTQHRNPPFGPGIAQPRQRSSHRGRVGVITFVDQQGFTTCHLQTMPRTAPLEPAQIGQRQSGNCKIRACRLHRGQNRERIGNPMVAGLRQFILQHRTGQLRSHQAATIGAGEMIDAAHICTLIEAKADNARGMLLCLCPQTGIMAAIERYDGSAIGFEPLKNLTLRVGYRFLATQIFDMRRGNRRDDGNMRADKTGERRDFLCMVHAHFEHAIFGFSRHARKG